MARIDGELVINRPVYEVFDFVADERNEPRYNPRIRRAEKLSPGPIGRGTRFRAEAVTLGRATGMTLEYTVYERPRRLASSIHMPPPRRRLAPGRRRRSFSGGAIGRARWGRSAVVPARSRA
jgi:hypothetical protein